MEGGGAAAWQRSGVYLLTSSHDGLPGPGLVQPDPGVGGGGAALLAVAGEGHQVAHGHVSVHGAERGRRGLWGTEEEAEPEPSRGGGVRAGARGSRGHDRGHAGWTCSLGVRVRVHGS